MSADDELPKEAQEAIRRLVSELNIEGPITHKKADEIRQYLKGRIRAPTPPAPEEGATEGRPQFPWNPAHPCGTCGDCGEEMVHNVPRMGPGGGFIHKATGSLRCGPTGTGTGPIHPFILLPAKPTEISKEAREKARLLLNPDYVPARDRPAVLQFNEVTIQTAIDTVAAPLRREVEAVTEAAREACKMLGNKADELQADLTRSRERCAELEEVRGELNTHITRLQARTEQLTAALAGLRRGPDGCFCDVSIGHPLVKSHTPQCLNAEKQLAASKEPNP